MNFPLSRTAATAYHALDHGGRRTLAGLIKRSFSLAGHRTSVALETAFWDVLHAAARSRGMSLSGLVAAVDASRDGVTPLASSLRLLALWEAQGQASKRGMEPRTHREAPALSESAADLNDR